MDGAIPDVIPRDHPVGSDLPLQTQVPLMNICNFIAPFEIDVEDALRKYDVGIQHRRKRIASRIAEPGIVEPARWIITRDLICPRRTVSSPVEHWRQVVEQSICRSNCGAAIAAHIPRQSQARRELEPGIGHVGIEAWIQRVARVLKPGGRILEDRTLDAFIKPFAFEMHRPAEMIRQGVRLPSYTRADGQARRGFPRVLDVHANRVLARCGQDRTSLDESGSFAQHEVGQSKPGEVAVECCRREHGRADAAIQHLMNPAHADPDLVPSPLERKIVTQVIRRRILVAGICIRTEQTESGVDGHDRHIRHALINTLCAKRRQIEALRSELRYGRPIDRAVKGVHRSRADQICFAQGK